jgi:hypothetical protein
VVLNKDFLGRSYPPTEPYEVSAEKIREFLRATGGDKEIVRPAGVEPDGPEAPPTFPILLSMAADRVVFLDPALGLDFSQVVHHSQRFTYSSPVLAGDRLTVQVNVEDVTSVAGTDMLTLRDEIHTESGRHVCTTVCRLVARAGDAR